MKGQPDRLYNLLPAIHRIRDAEQGYPLRALLAVIAEQVNVVETDIAQLYDNWFIETCADWVVPYIGDLVGYRIAREAIEPGAALNSAARNRVLIPRRDVADTIRNRRRKGALALLEDLARDVADWPARAVEFYKLLGRTQNINHAHIDRGGTVDLRRMDALDRLNGPFDELAHTVDVRRVNSHRGQGRYNIPGVGLFVWRLKSYSITEAPAHCEDRQRHHYAFSILGADAPLFTKTIDEPSPAHIADEMNAPAPIRRLRFEQRPEDYYGVGKSLVIYRDSMNNTVPIENIVVADLTDWAYQPVDHQVAVDPQLGRIAFSSRRPPQGGVWVSYHYGFAADVGGGEYDRPLRPSANVIKVGAKEEIKRISDALAKWREYRKQNEWPEAVIEITDSGVYTEQLVIELRTGERLELRAAANRRPVIRLLDFYANRPDAMQITGGDISKACEGEQESGPEPDGQNCNAGRAPRLVLDGLLIAGRGAQVSGKLESVTIRHCTLVPGWSLDCDCEPEQAAEPSLEFIDATARVAIEHSILGAIQVTQREVTTDPLPINISDSIIDATDWGLEAIGAPDCPAAHTLLTIKRSTVIGRVEVHAIELAENSIFDGLVKVARRQLGCMRFCYAAPGSRTPRRFNCQPDVVRNRAKDDAAKTVETLRVRPRFNSRRYGKPDYCQLSNNCAEEIKRGADDESEMGVFHDLFQPQREANLRARLDEYTPAGMNAGVIFAS
jgi:hypothetical protein